jgi:hypothetical protein
VQFTFFIGGYFGSHFELVLKKGELTCFFSEKNGSDAAIKYIFSIEEDPDWQLLLQFLQTLKWKKHYDNGSLDGTQWSLKFRHKDIQLNSHGSNSYPNEFKKLLQLLNTICGKHGIPKIH